MNKLDYFYEPPIKGNEFYEFVHAYSLWLQPSEWASFDAIQEEIYTLANLYNGTYHQPHATLYGAVYTSNESYVLEVAKLIASQLTPLTLRYKSMDCKKPNMTRRWVSTCTVRYKEDKEFKEAATLAMKAYGQKDCQKPHTSLLYNYDGSAYGDQNAVNKTIKRLEDRLGTPLTTFTWTANAVNVIYTPLRAHWRNSLDMRAIVSKWYRVASFKMSAVKHQKPHH